MTHREKVPERHIDARCFVSVIVNTQPYEPWPCKLVVSYRQPDMGDHSGAFKIRHYERFPRHDAFAVVVARHKTVSARNPPACIVFHPREIKTIHGRDAGNLRTAKSATEQKQG